MFKVPPLSVRVTPALMLYLFHFMVFSFIIFVVSCLVCCIIYLNDSLNYNLHEHLFYCCVVVRQRGVLFQNRAREADGC